MEDALNWGGILTRIAAQLLPVWVALIATFALVTGLGIVAVGYLFNAIL